MNKVFNTSFAFVLFFNETSHSGPESKNFGKKSGFALFYLVIIKNVFFSKTFDAELMLRTAALNLSCYENNFSEIDF
jgi:hypothetical protein